MTKNESTEQGWRIKDWCPLAGFSDQQLSILVKQGRGPHLVKLGPRLVVITESPQAYFARMALEPPPARPAKPPAPKKPSPAAYTPAPAPRRKPRPRVATAKRTVRA